MGEEDVRRQALNVYRMHLLGAEVRPVTSGTRTLKDATNEAMRDWVTNVARHALHPGQRRGPGPVPADGARLPVRHRREARAQMLEVEGRLAAAVVACVGGGSNAIGIFHPFVKDDGRGARGRGGGGGGARHRPARGLADPRHAGRAARGHSATCCRTTAGQVAHAHSVSAGLDYPGVGPEHAYLKDERPRHLRGHQRRRGAGRVRPLVAARGDHPRAGDRPTPSRTCCATAPAGRTAAPCSCA